ncbi:MAG: glycerophosphodiester phosphodiesterase family protein [Ferruginibacter sp.]
MTNSLPTGFDKEGHRGCRGLMPENTIPAMLKAIDLGVNTLEMDIVFTADNVAILSHEPFFNHVISTRPDGQFIEEKDEKNYNIYKMSFAETQRYDVGLKPHPRFPQQKKIAVHKPSLSSLIDSVENYISQNKTAKVFYNIETKTQPATDNIFHPGPAAFVDMLMKVIKEKNIEDRVIIQSFDMRTLQYLHKKYPEIKTALLIELTDRNSFRKQLIDLGFIPSIYSPEQGLVTSNLIGACHEKKIRIIPWTVDDKKRILRLKAMGVDGIITDFPNLFNEY